MSLLISESASPHVGEKLCNQRLELWKMCKFCDQPVQCKHKRKKGGKKGKRKWFQEELGVWAYHSPPSCCLELNLGKVGDTTRVEVR